MPFFPISEGVNNQRANTRFAPALTQN